jgi:hypothetical protein
MSSDSTETFKYYHYDPSLAGACAFAILFGASTLWHSVLISKHRTWYFIPLLIGGICMYSVFLNFKRLDFVFHTSSNISHCS